MSETTVGKILYGFLFLIALPAGLLAWERSLNDAVSMLPVISAPSIGLILAASGVLLMASGWWAIIRYGKGLPMNAFPPERLVTQGIYALLPHPIYTGFAILAAGSSLFTGSAPGLWLVTPTIVFCCTALVLGYERHDMERRFGNGAWQTAIGLPPAEEASPLFSDRISVYALVFLPWLILYEAVIFLGPAPDAIETYFAFERLLPVIEWAEMPYALTYPFVLAAPLVARRRKDLRSFMLMGLWATILAMLCFLLLPLQATPRPFVATSFWGRFLMIERTMDGPAGAFPSFHVTWSLLAAWLYAKSGNHGRWWYLAALVIAISCITTGMHSIIDVVGAVIVYLAVRNARELWFRLLAATERVANSWREWRFGSARVIVHGAYAGLGAFSGLTVAAHLAGRENAWHVLLVGVTTLLGAGIWGQALEGSSKLSRPFGYYGGLLGAVLGIMLAAWFGANGWQLAGAFAVVGPFVQAVGRLRCLVQGCCHGKECSREQGIMFSHAKSRVLFLAALGHRPVYPTQLYSILYNLVLGALLVRAWSLSVSMPLIGGSYLLYGSIGRFIEEAYRGEPQTPRAAGLAVYQWLALAGMLAGAVVMTFPGQPCTLESIFMPWFLAYSVPFGILVAFAMGVDFPESKKRFSRLA